ncbi:MAG TPA: mechanosensitive ion channel domain-containing protein [Acidobacteriota bacterium]|nr:mechanosensitive ion channel domain-containing protein [Acidobacteriota bacterium]
MDNYFDIRLFDLGGTPITVATLVTFAIIIVSTLVISRILEAATVRAFKIRNVTDEGAIGVAQRLVHYLVLVIGAAIAFQTIGINLNALFAAGALFAVALGFAMQNITQNFVSGVILLIERSIKPGDILKVEGRLVRVIRMGIRSTVSRSLDDEEIIIPNSMLVQNSVTNYTFKDRLYRLRALVGVVYWSDMALVRETLEKVAGEISWRVKSHEPRILLRQFGSSSVDFDVSVWIDDPWRAQQRLSELYEAIWWALKEAEITIAFPQVDVHLDSPVMRSLADLALPRKPDALS